MADQQREQDAFFAFFATFELERPVVSLSDISDGQPLFEVLQVVYVVNNFTRYYHLVHL